MSRLPCSLSSSSMASYHIFQICFVSRGDFNDPHGGNSEHSLSVEVHQVPRVRGLVAGD